MLKKKQTYHSIFLSLTRNITSELPYLSEKKKVLGSNFFEKVKIFNQLVIFAERINIKCSISTKRHSLQQKKLKLVLLCTFYVGHATFWRLITS